MKDNSVLPVRKSFFRKIELQLEHSGMVNSREKLPNDVKLKAYWNIGQLIDRERKSRGITGKIDSSFLKGLAGRMMDSFGADFDHKNLLAMQKFYQRFPVWEETLAGLTWSHYLLLLRMKDFESLRYYYQEALKNHWSTTQLARQIRTFYYERKRNEVDESKAPGSILQDTIVLEFLDLEPDKNLLEKELESSLLDQLQLFLLELGRGFSFVSRQQRIFTPSGKYFYIDLVFYHYVLKCFVLIDLKISELSHRDIGQMDMYVRLFEDQWRGTEDNPTLGIILCTHKDQTILKYSMLNESKHLFAAKYQFHLPRKEEFCQHLVCQ